MGATGADEGGHVSRPFRSDEAIPRPRPRKLHGRGLPARLRPRLRLTPEEEEEQARERLEKEARHKLRREIEEEAQEREISRRIEMRLIGLCAAVGLAALLGWTFTTSLRRTAEAPATIIDETPSLTAPDKTPQRLVLEVRYTFEVGGRTYTSVARRGSGDKLSDAKVCYEPGNPKGNHRLEPANKVCGSFDPLQPGDA